MFRQFLTISMGFVVATLMMSSFMASAMNERPLNVKSITRKDIPRGIKVIGKLKDARSWEDKNGTNLLTVSVKGPLYEKGQEYEEGVDPEFYAILYANQYLLTKDGYKLLWSFGDSVRRCDFEMWLGIMPNSIKITDLDSNGVSETLFITNSSCRSDVTPSDMKLVLVENGNIMKLQGYMAFLEDLSEFPPIDLNKFEPNLQKIDTKNMTKYDKENQIYGRYNNEDDFKNKPKLFFEYAKKEWLNHIKLDSFERSIYDK